MPDEGTAAPVAPAAGVAAPAVEIVTPVPEAVPAAQVPAVVEPQPTLLQPAAEPEAAPAATPEPAEAKPEATAEAPSPEAVPEAAPEPAKYEPFRFAEAIKVAEDDPEVAKFTVFAQSHGLSQDEAQGLVDIYSAAATKYAEELQQNLTQRQFDAFAKTVTGWREQFESDPEFKNRANTVVGDAQWAIREFGGNETQQKELNDALLVSGLGNHRAVIRAFANVAKRLKEARPGPRPAPATARPADPAQRRYPKMGA